MSAMGYDRTRCIFCVHLSFDSKDEGLNFVSSTSYFVDSQECCHSGLEYSIEITCALFTRIGLYVLYSVIDILTKIVKSNEYHYVVMT